MSEFTVVFIRAEGRIPQGTGNCTEKFIEDATTAPHARAAARLWLELVWPFDITFSPGAHARAEKALRPRVGVVKIPI